MRDYYQEQHQISTKNLLWERITDAFMNIYTSIILSSFKQVLLVYTLSDSQLLEIDQLNLDQLWISLF